MTTQTRTRIFCATMAILLMAMSIHMGGLGESVLSLITGMLAVPCVYGALPDDRAGVSEYHALDWEETMEDSEEVEAVSRQEGLGEVNGYTLLGWG